MGAVSRFELEFIKARADTVKKRTIEEEIQNHYYMICPDVQVLEVRLSEMQLIKVRNKNNQIQRFFRKLDNKAKEEWQNGQDSRIKRYWCFDPYWPRIEFKNPPFLRERSQLELGLSKSVKCYTMGPGLHAMIMDEPRECPVYLYGPNHIEVLTIFYKRERDPVITCAAWDTR